MSRSAADVISLDEYRRSRGRREPAAPSTPIAAAAMLPAMAAVPGPVWVYWVPVWIW